MNKKKTQTKARLAMIFFNLLVGSFLMMGCIPGKVFNTDPPDWNSTAIAAQTYAARFTPTTLPATLSPKNAPGKIVFVERGNHIYVMNANGSNKTAIGPEYNAKSPSWSPDGKKIAFVLSDGTDVRGDIYVMNVDDSKQVQLTHTGSDLHPAWSPDGKKIAFDSGRESDETKGKWVREIYVMDADGSNQTRLTKNVSGNSAESPDWSSDSKKLAFESKSSSGKDIYIMNADGSNLVNLTNTGGSAHRQGASTWYQDNRQPAWSPDGSKIAFVASNDEGAWNIFVINVDGSNLINITKDSNYAFEPAWSPDGSKIVFVSNRDAVSMGFLGFHGYEEIYIMNGDGSNIVRLTKNKNDESSPAWLP